MDIHGEAMVSPYYKIAKKHDGDIRNEEIEAFYEKVSINVLKNYCKDYFKDQVGLNVFDVSKSMEQVNEYFEALERAYFAFHKYAFNLCEDSTLEDFKLIKVNTNLPSYIFL